jgi:hypothetical protein
MKLTIEEAIAMRGFEFTYVFDGDSIPAYVKEFDLKLVCRAR